MAHLSDDDLRDLTLRRQFPPVSATGADGVVELLDRLGPVQSQVPRAPFLTIASRLPGATYSEICELFESHRLLRASNLRGTVHTSTRRSFGWLDAVATRTRASVLRRGLQLSRTGPDDVGAEVRRYCATDWVQRDDLVQHLRDWLATEESPTSAAAVQGTFGESLIWGNSGLLRRPRDRAWDRRTDSWHRTAAPLVRELAQAPFPAALTELVRGHLAAHGPVSRRDLSFFFGVGLTDVDAAVGRLGAEVERHAGPDHETYVDLAEPPPGGSGEVGLRLLGEFDALLLGFCGSHRTRFVDADGLSRVWAKANGLFSSVVLYDRRLVATWRSVTTRDATVLDVWPLPSAPPLTPDLFTDAAADVGHALGQRVSDVRLLQS